MAKLVRLIHINILAYHFVHIRYTNCISFGLKYFMPSAWMRLVGFFFWWGFFLVPHFKMCAWKALSIQQESW